MTDNLRERIARAIHEDLSRQDIMAYLDGKFDAGKTADAVLTEMRKEVARCVMCRGEGRIPVTMMIDDPRNGFIDCPHCHSVDAREITTSGVDDRGEGIR